MNNIKKSIFVIFVTIVALTSLKGFEEVFENISNQPLILEDNTVDQTSSVELIPDYETSYITVIKEDVYEEPVQRVSLYEYDPVTMQVYVDLSNYVQDLTKAGEPVYDTIEEPVYQDIKDPVYPVTLSLKKAVLKTTEGKLLAADLKKIRALTSSQLARLTNQERTANTFKRIKKEVLEQEAAEINAQIKAEKKANKKYKKTDFKLSSYIDLKLSLLQGTIDLLPFTTGLENIIDFITPSVEWADLQAKDNELKNDFNDLRLKIKKRQAFDIESLAYKELSNDITQLAFAISKRQNFFYDFVNYVHAYKANNSTDIANPSVDGLVDRYIEDYSVKMKLFVEEIIKQL